MNLGERCDEIVRLIDETLAGLALDDDASSEDTPTRHAPATVTSLPPRPGRGGVGRRGAA